MDQINIYLVVALSILAVSLLVFVAFFIPILIHIAKLFQEINALVILLRTSIREVFQKFEETCKTVSKLSGSVGGAASNLLLKIKDMIGI